MTSTIKVDYEDYRLPNGQALSPVIKISLDKSSDDVRDKLLRTFFESLGHASNWLLVKFEGEDKYGRSLITLSPVSPDRLKYNSEQMTDCIGIAGQGDRF